MTCRLTPPSLRLPALTDVRVTSVFKALINPEEYWPREMLEQPSIELAVRGRPLVFIADPEQAKAVLSANHTQLAKHPIYAKVAGAGAGARNVVVAEGERFKHQKQVLAPLFAARRMPQYTPLFHAAIEGVSSRWRELGPTDQTDVLRDATQITFETIWRLMFGASDLSAAVPAWVTEAGDTIHWALLERNMPGIARALKQTATRALEHPPKRSFLDPNPFLTSPGVEDVSATVGLGQSEIFDNVRVFLSAGHETSATAITWCLWLLGQDLETQRRIHDEIGRVVGGDVPHSHHLPHLPLLGQAVKESLRLYPSAPVTVRYCDHDVRVGGRSYPKGATIAVSFYALHRHRGLWDRPDEYDPARFGPHGRLPRHPYSYLPFSAGPHACIGAAFGWEETMLVLATLLSEFRVITQEHDIRPQMLLGMRPNRGVMLRVERRR